MKPDIFFDSSFSLIQDGQNTVWPHDFHTGWSYCVTIPSWKLSSESSASESVVVGILVNLYD